MSDRRSFLGQSAAAAFGLLCAPGRRSATEVTRRLLTSPSLITLSNRRLSPTQHIPPVLDADALRALAKTAIETAVGAGADFADIRVADRQLLQIWRYPTFGHADYGIDLSYGVRARVNGQWAFAYGTVPTAAGVQTAAQQAVASARALKMFGDQSDPFQPAPKVTGEWSAPMQIDPFDVSLDDLVSTVAALWETPQAAAYLGSAGVEALAQWVREIRVVANSEGTLVTQNLMSFLPDMAIDMRERVEGWRSLQSFLPELAPSSAGFEAANSPEVQEHMRRVAEEGHEYFRYPMGQADVGRYEAVYDGGTVGSLAIKSLVPAMQLDRVLGNQANEVGTCFLPPIDQAMSTPMFAAALNVSTDRAAPHLGAAKWDDEGVETAPFPLVTKGTIVNWLGTRRTIAAVAQAGHPSPLHGTAVAALPTRAPVGMANTSIVHAKASGPSRDELMRQMGNGLLLIRGEPVVMDQQLASGVIYPGRLFRVKNGKITHWLRNGTINFQTKRLWNSIAAVGGPETTLTSSETNMVGQPFTLTHQVASAPAMLLKDVDLTIHQGW